MDDKQIKNSIDECIGEEKLFNDALKNRILFRVNRKENDKGLWIMLKKITPAFVLLLTIVGGITFFMLLKSDNKEQMTSPNIEYIGSDNNHSQGTEDLATPNTNQQLQLQDEFREVLNLTFQIINAMVEKDYTYLSEVCDQSVEMNTTNHTIKFNAIGENGYEANLLEDFDFKTMEYRGYHIEGDEMFIFLAINHIAYEFTFIKGNSQYGNYLLKSIITN